MILMSHPDNRKDKITERQKALKLCKDQRQLEKKGRFVKVENGVQNLYKFIKYE